MKSNFPLGVLASLVLSSVLLSSSSVNLSGQEIPVQARQVAIDYFNKTITLYKQPSRSAFAIDNMKLNSIDDLSRASLGEPYKVFKMSMQQVGTVSNAADCIARAVFLYYEFPIIIDGLGHGVIRIIEKDGTWEPFGGGGREDIYDFLMDSRTFTSRSLIYLGPNLIFALVEKKDEYYIIPSNEHSADAFGVNKSCLMIPYKSAMRAFTRKQVLQKETSISH
jgi:hypothetical protein